jgi:hypothetical protein
LITALVQKVRACARSLAILVCVDGLASYLTPFLRVFRDPVRTGRRGRPWSRVCSSYIMCRDAHTAAYCHQALCLAPRSHGCAPRGAGDRHGYCQGAQRHRRRNRDQHRLYRGLNATFRSALAPLARRGRAIAHTEAVLTAGIYSLGCAYDFCWYHDSLRLAAPKNAPRKWQERLPAMAAGLTDHPWILRELLLLKVPLPSWIASKRRGRPPQQKLQPLMALAA